MVVYSCGDIFAKRRNIVGNYYLYEEEGISEYSIRYKLKNGDYIGRIPAPVVEYGWTDSILVVKSKRDTIGEVYIINMKKDSEFAEESEYLIEILNYEKFDNSWQKKLKIKFKRV
jgi:hypothetical protein